MTKATAQKQKLTAQQFRVFNYRNIDDSGWIPLEKVTCFGAYLPNATRINWRFMYVSTQKR